MVSIEDSKLVMGPEIAANDSIIIFSEILTHCGYLWIP